MVPFGILLLLVGGVVVGAFLKLFADHRAFRRELRELNQQLETVLDVVSTLTLDAGDSIRVQRVQRQVEQRQLEEQQREPRAGGEGRHPEE